MHAVFCMQGFSSMLWTLHVAETWFLFSCFELDLSRVLIRWQEKNELHTLVTELRKFFFLFFFKLRCPFLCCEISCDPPENGCSVFYHIRMLVVDPLNSVGSELLEMFTLVRNWNWLQLTITANCKQLTCMGQRWRIWGVYGTGSSQGWHTNTYKDSPSPVKCSFDALTCSGQYSIYNTALYNACHEKLES